MPRNPQSMIAANFNFADGAVEAAKKFAKSKPYRGTIAERRAKFETFHSKLCEVHGVEIELDFIGDNNPDDHSGDSAIAINLDIPRLSLVGRLSIVTYLTLFGTKLSEGNMNKAERWAFNLFQRSFPRSFARLVFDRDGLAVQSND